MARARSSRLRPSDDHLHHGNFEAKQTTIKLLATIKRFSRHRWTQHCKKHRENMFDCWCGMPPQIWAPFCSTVQGTSSVNVPQMQFFLLRTHIDAHFHPAVHSLQLSLAEVPSSCRKVSWCMVVRALCCLVGGNLAILIEAKVRVD